MSEADIESEIRRKGLNAPRLTPELISDVIRGKDFHVFEKSCLTVCCLTLQNGFTVTGESACASPKNFDAEIGEKIAYENARNKIWALEGYLLKQKLFEIPVSFQERLETERDELREKFVKLTAFFDSETFQGLPALEQLALQKQSEYMLSYVTVLDQRVSRSF